MRIGDIIEIGVREIPAWTPPRPDAPHPQTPAPKVEPAPQKPEREKVPA